MEDSNPPAAASKANGGCQASEQELALVRDALRGLRYGAVHIIVQDGVIVQIERIDRRRLRKSH